MYSTEAQMVHTCGVCETIIHEDEVPKHPCMEGYNQIFVDDNFYVYPSTEDGTIIRRSCMEDNTEAIVSEEPSMSGSEQPLSTDLATTEELLIEEVSKREILYNYHLPISQRSRLAVTEEWERVSEALNGQISAKEAQKKWKVLRDTFCRKMAEGKQPSGAAGSSKRRKWKHFDRMLFLRDILQIRPTTTNDDHVQESIERSGTPKRKKSQTSSETIEERPAINKIADAISALAAPVLPPTLPSPPTQDDVDGLFLILGGQLRRLPHAQRTSLILEILQFVHQRINL